MIVRVWCESGAGWSPTHVPVTPQTSCRDVVECCREPGDEPCLLLSVHPQHGEPCLTSKQIAKYNLSYLLTFSDRPQLQFLYPTKNSLLNRFLIDDSFILFKVIIFN
ncbi:hypothetical protein ABMA28_003754 [Loxostege sticticalis]|uniref:Ras association domain-containing protein n=1 Tax=Loxostege sticticalis TaxID=481309 RepID=A0ABD0SSX6_LOXSC